MSANFLKKLFLWTGFAFLLGRAYQHIFFEGPYRAFFLDESLFSWWVKAIGGDWFTYVNDPVVDQYILFYTRSIGIFWWITAMLLLLLSFNVAFLLRNKRLVWISSWISSITLFFLAFCYFLEKGYQWAQWIEYSAQFCFPVLAVWSFTKLGDRWFILGCKIAIALTFLGHGLYALGYFPVPGNFVYMVIESLKLNNEQAVNFIYIAGVLDMIVVLFLFIPKLDKYALLYAFLWGFLTSLARPWTMIVPNHLFWLTVHQSLFEFVTRIPHFMLPLLTYFVLRFKMK